MKSINDPFDPAALSDEELPEYVREYSAMRTEENQWRSIKLYFDMLCVHIQSCRIETRAEALDGTFLVDLPEKGPADKYKHEFIVPFRETDDAAMLEEQLRTAQSLILKMRAGIDARTMTFDFIHDWGLLNYASGYVMCTWFARDSDDLASARGGLNHNVSEHKRFFARHMLPLLEGMSHKDAHLALAEKIKSAIADDISITPFGPSELSEFLVDGKRLKTTYTKLTKPKLQDLLGQRD